MIQHNFKNMTFNQNNVGNMHINKICTYTKKCNQQLENIDGKVYCNDILPCGYWSEDDEDDKFKT